MNAVTEQLFFHVIILDMLTRKIQNFSLRQPLRYPGMAPISAGFTAQIAQNLCVVISN